MKIAKRIKTWYLLTVAAAVIGLLNVSTAQASICSVSGDTLKYDGQEYHIIAVDGGDMSGIRLPDAAVDIGYGDRVYWGLTNQYGQLVHVIAKQIILQDDEKEPVNENGRYYADEARVPGTELPELDQGHVIADSLGGVSNAYNITPQDTTLNRHGNQAYMEAVIRSAGGCKDFVATITYPDTVTQIPSAYHYEYVLNGSAVVDDFPNTNPDAAVAPQAATGAPQAEAGTPQAEAVTPQTEDISRIDTNGNGIVTIKEAKAAGFKMPIDSTHWLYQYMIDGDGDGMVGE